ncbi:MAG: Penicillin-binding protein 4* [Haliscomenobacter sp.]|jgi:CubicO group peptidase (beta-lactamase class C family)|nr:Penicillin-binding protein 4* [Haliscomenobacter sp.]
MKTLILMLAACLAFSCTRHSEKDPAKLLDAYFSAEFSADGPGAAVLVMRQGKVLFEKGYGLADLEKKTPITPSTAFNTGSISKTFVSNAILMLREEGKLSLDDPLETYFPEFKNPDIAKKVKIYHLLNHSSGLADSRRVAEDSVFYLTAKDEENFAPIKQNDTTYFEPGTRYRYSNPAFNGLALIIQQITGKRWQDFIIDRIFAPSGMTGSKITDGPYPQTGVAHAYVWDQGKFIEDDYGEEPTFAASGNGGVWSSVRDLAKYEEALQKAVFLPKDVIQKSRTPFQPANWQDTLPSFIGYSWFTGTEKETPIVFHTGHQGGFTADYVWVPSNQLFYVILCNSPRPIEQYRGEVLKVAKLRGSEVAK